MEIDKNILNPFYVKRTGKLTPLFLLSVFFCSTIESTDRLIIYLLFISNNISYDYLRSIRGEIDVNLVMELLFELSNDKKVITKKELRRLIDLQDRKTFNKYFNAHLESLGILKNRSYTLRQVYEILVFWIGEENIIQNKFIRLRAFTKKELVSSFTDGKYEDLELGMDNIIDGSYKNYDYIKPVDSIKFIETLPDIGKIESQKHFHLETLWLIFSLFCSHALKIEKGPSLNISL